MKNLVIVFIVALSISNLRAQTGDPYYLGLQDYPQLKLPSDLRIHGVSGKIIVHLKLDRCANILNIEWIALLLNDDKGNCFIRYREAVNKGYTLLDYPLSIRPYFELIENQIKELDFKRDERIARSDGDWYFTIPYQVE